MPTLTVRDFSCIDHAVLNLTRLTVLIGPQASGKSVLSKLLYFFQHTISAQFVGSEVEDDFASFKEHTSAEFKRWFPVSAWGAKKFHIEFNAGPITIVIDRKKSYKKPSEGFHIFFSEFFEECFHRNALSYKEALAQSDPMSEARPYLRWEMLFQARRAYRQMLEQHLGDDFTSSQMFVPAGRAFFTSIGKAMAAFEKSGFLDPATLSFGRYWAAMRDDDPYIGNEAFPASNAKLMIEIFGGELKVDRDLEYVLSPDGRKVPLSALSSGQQELLPLWMTVERYFSDDEHRESPANSSMMYIEEPEAHLFPHAQSMLIEYLASRIYQPARNNRKMLITTHSPYVLAKFNNLLKASQVARKASREQVAYVSSIIPRVSWIRSGHLNAYAIIDRRLVSIMDDTGLIEATYLDGVSDEIMNQFNALLEVQYGQ